MFRKLLVSGRKVYEKVIRKPGTSGPAALGITFVSFRRNAKTPAHMQPDS